MIGVSLIVKPILQVLFCFLHVIVSLVHLWWYLVYQIQCLVISCGLLPKYHNLKLDRLKHLAIVIDSEEAKNKSKVQQLLFWLSDLGVKYVILYDFEGVMKKSDKALQKNTVRSDTNCLDFDLNVPLTFDVLGMTVEVISYTDNKEATAKAANYLCSNFLKNQEGSIAVSSEPKFTESDVSSALKAVGHGGPEPDLLLVYGPARCHLGFPAWRLKYTEIVHMGPLNSMKCSAIVKVFYDFSKKHQNYGK